MKILLTGASGLLGINFALTALGTNHQVLGIFHKQSIHTSLFHTQSLDLSDTTSLHSIFASWEPDWVVHCAALADINQCEKDPALAQLLNVELSNKLAAISIEYNTRFLYISTDGVFDGKKSGYKETDVPYPLNMYAKTKLAGEEAVRKTCPNALIARVNFYGWSLTGKKSLSEWIINQLRQQKTITGFQDVMFSPLLTTTLAAILLEMMARNLTGIYHVLSSDSISKYDFAVYLAQQFQLDEALIQPGSAVSMRSNIARPLNLALNNDKLCAALGRPIGHIKNDLQTLCALEKNGYVETLAAMRNIKNGN